MHEEKETEASGMQDQEWKACAEQLAGAAASLEKVLEKLEAQYAALNQKIDRIIAAVEKDEDKADNGTSEGISASALRKQVADLERNNANLREQVQRAGRKTLPATVSTLLAKGGMEEGSPLEIEKLEKALGSLSVEQRIAVKAEMLRAGLLG